MKTLVLAASLIFSPVIQNNPEWYSKSTQVNCIDGRARFVEGRVILHNNLVTSAHATRESVVYTPDGIGFRMNGDFELNEQGRLVKGYTVSAHNFFTPNGVGVQVQGFIHLNSNSRIVKCELASERTLHLPDGSARQFIGFVKFNDEGRVTAGKLAADRIFYHADGSAIQVEAGKVVYLNENGRLLYTRDSWDSWYEFEINRD